MVIEVLIFFMFIILFVVVGGVISWMMRRKRQTATESKTGWPLRNWIALFIVIVIFGPLVFHWLRNSSRREAHRESLQQRPVNGGTGSSSPSGGAVPPGDSARPGSIIPGATPVNNTVVKDVNDSTQKGTPSTTKGANLKSKYRITPSAKDFGKDTSYHVAAPPQH